MEKQAILDHFSGDFRPYYDKYLHQIKSTNNGQILALCPFHNEENPSFSVNTITSQYFCQACNKSGDFIHFFAKVNGLDTRRDFGKILSGIASDFGITEAKAVTKRNTPKPTCKPKGQIVKTYDYTDEAGNLLFQVCRFDPKDFRQRRPVGDGWKWSLDGLKPVLYRLPEVLKAEEVIIVEGEKDADALSNLGFIGSTAPMGAGKWKSDYTEPLKSKHVILIPDADLPGKKHMVKVAQSLNGQVKSLKWLDLPDLLDAGDVSDFISGFQDPETAAERLAVMIENSGPYYPPPAAGKSTVKALRIGDLKKMYNEKIEWIWMQHLPRGESCLFAGREGTGKTKTGIKQAKDICNQYPDYCVVWLATEGTIKNTLFHANAIGVDSQNFFFAQKENGDFGFNLGTASDKKAFGLFLGELGKPVIAVFIDSVRGAFPTLNENDPLLGNQMREVNKIACDRHKATLVWIHHENKQGRKTGLNRVSGNTSITAAVRHVLSIKKKTQFVRIIKCSKSNIDDTIPELEVVEVKGDLRVNEPAVGSVESMGVKAEKFLAEIFSGQPEISARMVFQMGELEGISTDMLNKVKSQVGIRSKRDPSGNGWVWYWYI